MDKHTSSLLLDQLFPILFVAFMAVCFCNFLPKSGLFQFGKELALGQKTFACHCLTIPRNYYQQNDFTEAFVCMMVTNSLDRLWIPHFSNHTKSPVYEKSWSCAPKAAGKAKTHRSPIHQRLLESESFIFKTISKQSSVACPNISHQKWAVICFILVNLMDDLSHRQAFLSFGFKIIIGYSAFFFLSPIHGMAAIQFRMRFLVNSFLSKEPKLL